MPQAQAYRPDGTPIPDGELAQAVAEGAAGFEADAEVLVRDSSGRRGVVKGAEVGQLLASGGSLETGASLAAEEAERQRTETERAHQGPLQTPLAGAESVARGLTFGLSDVAASELLGPEYTAGARARKEAHPLLTGAHELSSAIGGTLGASLLTGGAGAPAAAARTSGIAGRLLQAATAPGRVVAGAGRAAEGLVSGVPGAAGRIAGMAASGAAEGALYDAGMEMSKAALEQRDLTADKLLAAVGHGALLGGAGGAVLGGGGMALSAAGRAALKGMGEGASLGQSLAGFAERRAVKSVVGNNQKLYNELTNFGAQPERLQRVGRKLLDRGVSLTNVDDGIRQVQNQLDDATTRLKGVAATLDEAGVKADVKTLLARVDDQVAKLRATPLEDFQAVAAKVESQVAPLRRAVAAPVGVFKRGADGKLTPMAGKEYGFGELWAVRKKLDDTIKWNARQGNPATDEIRKLRATFEDTLGETIEAQRPDLSPVWRGAKEDYRDFATIGDALEELQIRGQKNRWTSPSDYAAGGLGFMTALAGGSSGVGSFITGSAASVGHKLLREKGPGVVARLADAIAKTDRRITNGVVAAVEGRALKKAKAEPVGGLFTAGVNEEVGEARALTAKGKDAERFHATLKMVRELRADPVAASRRMGETTAIVADWSPEIAEALQQRIIRGAQFLEERMPPMFTRQATSLTPHLEPTRIPPMELRRTIAYMDALDDPASLLDDLSSGRMPRQKIEAIKAVAPDLFADIRGRVMRELSERGETVPYNRRVLLSLAFDFTGDRSLDPAYMARIQATFAPAAPEEQQPGGGGADIDADTFAADLETETQKLSTGA